MGTKISLLLLLSFFLLSTTIAFSSLDSKRGDPEDKLEQCRKRCSERRHGWHLQQQCEHKCLEKYQEERRQQEQEQDGKSHRPDPEQQLEECRQQCRQEEKKGEKQQQQQCEQKCWKKYEEERREQEEGGSSSSSSEEEEESRSDNNPYVFKPKSFIHWARTQHGSIRVLKNFLQKSKLLLGIANYRLVIFEANPRTFAVPKHSDADVVFFVVKGEGVITLLRTEENSLEIRKESHKIRKGDIIRVQSGTVVYIINNSSNNKLRIAKLVQPVSTPGQFQDFYTVGGGNPQSFLKTFSSRLLQAALNTEQEKLERIFGRQDQGVIVEASEEQIRGLSRHTSEGSSWPFGGGSSSRTFNLLQKRPDHSNEHGKLFIANFDDYEQLKDLNLHVTFVNITRGSMMAPFFESKATKIAVVVEGDGEFEMVCPHLSSQSQQESEESESESEEGKGQGQQQERNRYQKIRSRLSQGTVFIIPAGHPAAIVASRNSNLQVICFEVNKNSRKIFLAGRNNVVNQMDKEAKELAFGVPSRLVDEVFGKSRQDVFVSGPEQRQEKEDEDEQRESRPLRSILEFVVL